MRTMMLLRAQENDTSVALENLSGREDDVLRLLAQGLTDAAIAARLGISVITVRRHMSTIREKLHCHNRVQVLIVALYCDLLHLSDFNLSLDGDN